MNSVAGRVKLGLGTVRTHLHSASFRKVIFIIPVSTDALYYDYTLYLLTKHLEYQNYTCVFRG